MLAGEEVEVFRSARPAYWLRGTIVKVDRVNDKNAVSPIVSIYAESAYDDQPTEGGWYRMADNVIRASRSPAEYKVNTAPNSVACLPLFYRAFLHARGPEAVMQLLESTYNYSDTAKDDQERWIQQRVRELSIRVLWGCDYIIRRSSMSLCRGDIITAAGQRKPAPRQWWDNECLLAALERLNTIIPIPVECVHALCTIAFGEHHPTSRSGHQPIYDIDGLSTRCFDSNQHWIIHALVYALTNTTLPVAKSGLKFFNFLLTRNDSVATAILAQNGWQRWFACLLTGVGGGPLSVADEVSLIQQLSPSTAGLEAKNSSGAGEHHEHNTLTLTFGIVIMILFRHFCDFDIRNNTETNPGM
jgi:hypothetical protein